MAKSMTTSPAMISVHDYFPHRWIADDADAPTPTLQDFSTAAWTAAGALCTGLDIREFQDNNRHGRLLLMAALQLPSCKELASFFLTNQF
jgi:hypothetical protein